MPDVGAINDRRGLLLNDPIALANMQTESMMRLPQASVTLPGLLNKMGPQMVGAPGDLIDLMAMIRGAPALRKVNPFPTSEDAAEFAGVDINNAEGLLAGVMVPGMPASKAGRLAQVRATNQNAVGQAVAAGMGPRNKAAQTVFDTGQFSANEALKVGPFSMQVRGLPAPRGVHDVRDIQAWGFPANLSPGPANHRWMDKVTDEAVKRANDRKLAGRTDWTHERLQAARWVKHKADDEGKSVEDLGREFGPADEWLTSNTFSEAIPSSELVDMARMSPQDRAAYTAEFARQTGNAEGQSVLAHQLGLLSPERRIAVGAWEGELNPNIVTSIMADPAKGADVMSDWSREAVNFHGALMGLLGGQADVATSFLRRSKRAGDINAVRIPVPGGVTPEKVGSWSRIIPKWMRETDIPGDVIVNVRNGDELEVTWLSPDDITPKHKREFRKLMDSVSNGRAIEARNSGGLITEQSEFLPSAYDRLLDNPKMRQQVSAMLPSIATDLSRTIDNLPLTDDGRKIYKKTLEVLSDGGLDGLRDAVKAGTLPAAVIGAVLFAANQAPQQPAQAQGQL